MNISFFLTPKALVTSLFDDCTVEQAMDKMMESGFTAIPMIDRKGKYIGTVCEGDFLHLLREQNAADLRQMPVGRMQRRFRHKSVSMDARMEDLADLICEQNFVPVIDGRGMFSGIVTRRDVIRFLRDGMR